jgi:hypothetical protein
MRASGATDLQIGTALLVRAQANGATEAQISAIRTWDQLARLGDPLSQQIPNLGLQVSIFPGFSGISLPPSVVTSLNTFSRARAREIRARLREINQQLKPKNVREFGNDVKALRQEQQRLLGELPPEIRTKMIDLEIAQAIEGDAVKIGEGKAAKNLGKAIGELENDIDKLIEAQQDP